jgi:hypothetical protein
LFTSIVAPWAELPSSASKAAAQFASLAERGAAKVGRIEGAPDCNRNASKLPAIPCPAIPPDHHAAQSLQSTNTS